MSAEPYTPRTGSTADLALKHLRAHGSSKEAVLAEAIDKEIDELQPLLQHAVRCGALHRDRQGFWHMGSADPIDLATKPKQNTVPAASCSPPETSAARSVFEQQDPQRGASTGIRARAAGVATEACEGAGAELPSRSSTTCEPSDVGAEAAQVPTRVQPPATPDDGSGLRAVTRFALWSDGVLEIQHGTERVGLAPATTRRLLDYLDRMREPA